MRLLFTQLRTILYPERLDACISVRHINRKEERTTKTRKVYIPQLPTRYDKATNQRIPAIDANPAAQFGELVTIFGQDVNRSQALATLRAGQPRGVEIEADDYILAVGDVVLLALTIVHALQRNGRATLLRWDNETKTYRTEEIQNG